MTKANKKYRPIMFVGTGSDVGKSVINAGFCRIFKQDGMSLIGNIIVMFFVMKGKKRFDVKNRFLEILTFLYRPIGVCLLLIQVIVESKKELDDSELITDK